MPFEAFLVRRGMNLRWVVSAAYRVLNVGRVEVDIAAYFCTVKKTLLTFRSITFANCESVWVSNGAPQVAPAFA